MNWLKKLLGNNAPALVKEAKLNDLERALMDSITQSPGEWEFSGVEGGIRCFNRKHLIVTRIEKHVAAFSELDDAVGAEFRAAFGGAAQQLMRERAEARRKEEAARQIKHIRQALQLDL